ncbi:hypothetical protein ACOME3_008568 [Neoechinorhynchus agilis]
MTRQISYDTGGFQNVKNGLCGPCERSGHCCISSGSFVFIWGGLTGSRRRPTRLLGPVIHSDLWRFDTIRDVWEECELSGCYPKSETLSSSAIAFCETFMLIYGGTGFPYGHVVSDQLYICNLNTFEFFKLECEPPLPRRYGAALALFDGYLYIHGGTTGHDYNSQLISVKIDRLRASIYNPDSFKSIVLHPVTLRNDIVSGLRLLSSNDEIDFTSKFEDSLDLRVAASTGGRFKHAMVAYRNYLFILGGWEDCDEVPSFKEILIYNIKKDFYRLVVAELACTVENQLYPVKCFSACQKSNGYEILLFNGRYDDPEDEQTKYLRTVWTLNLNKMKWDTLP